MPGTGLNRAMEREAMTAVFQWLAGDCSIAHAARQVGMTPAALTAGIRRFRQWLLLLDSSGKMEQKVRLGRSKDHLADRNRAACVEQIVD
ncbi:DUF746 domain-containing protein [Burkholderia sp. LMG 21824]|uniref:DUF746 domain-containing protein n=1 Tax=Burkholderia sp. LMG 21824 TaxID=3158172 RepID=UPI003C2BD67B